MKRLVVGILAHVDAGKTTLSESMLYLSGKIRKLGRVDNRDTFLDTYELEKARGITIFSKQAVFRLDDILVTLMDTPGHVDFSTEMERTLQVLDYAILVISGSDGVQGHTKTLWRLLNIYRIPVFIFVNKMDQNRKDRHTLMAEMRSQLSDRCVDFGEDESESFYEQLALCDESLMDGYLDSGQIDIELIRNAVKMRKVFPCYFGSALKLDGVEEFMNGIAKYSEIPSYTKKFGARVYKIGRDEKGNRLTFMKITGGKLKVRDIISIGGDEEKVTQIRIYSGQKFETVDEAKAGTVCAVTGLTRTRAGDGLGEETALFVPVLEPVLSYRIVLPEGCDPRVMLPKLRELEEEEPELHIVWNEQLKEIQVQIMGEVQLEILQSMIKSRFGVDVTFDSGRVVYKETIANTVEGVGHFEPLRHYAEVHLLLEPAERGSGLEFAVDCSDDVLGRNWKNLILTHLKEKVHKGVLTGSPITDMKITLVSGLAHVKHTDGGDFREATYRAVRQGLKEAQSVLLEPYYAFQLELPEKFVGRAMADIERMHGTCHVTQIADGIAILSGSAPVSTFQNYQKDVTAYTKGLGRLFCTFKGYDICHNADEVIAAIGYDSEKDPENPTGSIFCANGTSFYVPWDKVKDYMHLESFLQQKESLQEDASVRHKQYTPEKWISPEEVEKIFERTFFANQGKKSMWQKRKPSASADNGQTVYVGKPRENKERYLLVDGYNIIFAWPELKEMAKENMDSAKSRLLDYLSKYKSVEDCQVIVVFDAYRVQGHLEEVIEYGNIYVVYTREAQTADQYIEKFAHDNSKKFDITVATSDGLQQVIIRGEGCELMTASELREKVKMTNENIIRIFREKQPVERNLLMDKLSEETKKRIQEIIEGD